MRQVGQIWGLNLWLTMHLKLTAEDCLIGLKTRPSHTRAPPTTVSHWTKPQGTEWAGEIRDPYHSWDPPLLNILLPVPHLSKNTPLGAENS